MRIPIDTKVVLCLAVIFRTAWGYSQIENAMSFPEPGQVRLTESILAEGISKGASGRIKTLPVERNGYFFKIYSKDSVSESTTCREARMGLNWQGEHAGKWMIAAARAANRTRDEELVSFVQKTADYLLEQQDQSGYLGTYIPSMRFYSDTRTDFTRTWDLWNNSYNILGFLELYRYRPEEKYLEAAEKIGNLILQTFHNTGKNIAYRGNHLGLSGVIVLEPVVELYKVTGDRKYLDFAYGIMEQMEERPELRLMRRTLEKTNIQSIGDGKIYQLLWIYTGIAKLYQATGEEKYLVAAGNAWKDVVDSHLTPTGGPWGGVGIHFETFNPGKFWSPYGVIETCNIMSWIQLNKELLKITGDARYADMLEKVYYNALLGAQYFDGECWHYFSYVNGIRSVTDYSACCRSSGMVSLEEIAPSIYSLTEKGIAVNIYTPSKTELKLPTGKSLTLEQRTGYPFDGEINLKISGVGKASFSLSLRIPGWAGSTGVKINGETYKSINRPDSYLSIERTWTENDSVTISIPMEYRVTTRRDEVRHRGALIHKLNWYSVSKGPLVYSTHGLIYGEEREEILNIDPENIGESIRKAKTPGGFRGPAIEILPEGKAPVLMLPYYEAGGIDPEGWRLTWLQYHVKE